MRKEILGFILCPYCKKANFKLTEQSRNDIEIRKGRLICQRCENIFSIHDGIIYLHKKFDKIVQKEQEAHIRMIKDENSLQFSEIEIKRSKLAIKNTLSFLKRTESCWTKGKKIIELGSGACWLISQLAKNHYCVALDINISSVNGLMVADTLTRNNNIFFERVNADMKNLPFKSCSFDIVIINAALHHSSDLPKTLKEIYRILASGGQLVLINEPVIGYLSESGRKRAISFKKMGFNEEMYSLHRWVCAFKDAGLNYKIYLPDNILDIIKLKGGIFKVFSNALRLTPRFIETGVIRLITKPSLIIFDGCFNAIIHKS